MNHQPFEDWLLNDERLGPVESRELLSHLRACRECASLANSGRILRVAGLVAPKLGFADRFRDRLVEYRAQERRRRNWGFVVLAAAGLSGLGWSAAPLAMDLAAAPAATMSGWLRDVLVLTSSIRALWEIGQVAIRLAPGLVPEYAWMSLVSAMAGLGLLWSVSVWRLRRISQGV
jgi:hypothetical protein